MHHSLLSCRYSYLNKLKCQSQNHHNRRPSELESHIYETYKNAVIPYGHHIYITASDMDIDTMCDFPPYKHALPHWKCVICCCSNFPNIFTPVQEWHNTTHTMCPTIHFHVYIVVPHFIVHVRHPF